MKNIHWEAIHEIYSKMEKLCGRSLYVPGNDLLAAENQEAKESLPQPELRQAACGTEDVVHIRAELRTQLDYLQAALADQYSERDTYLVLFAVVAQIDELIQTNLLRTLNINWPLMQKELFQIDNAGEVFYEILDDVLLKPQTPVFIYEVYFFCLRYGFRGRYENSPVKITEYLKKLQARLHEEELETEPEAVQETGHVRTFASPYWNYLVMSGVVVTGYLILLVIGSYK